MLRSSREGSSVGDVFRELLVVPPGGCGGQASITVREKVTWDECNENVRFTLYGQPHSLTCTVPASAPEFEHARRIALASPGHRLTVAAPLPCCPCVPVWPSTDLRDCSFLVLLSLSLCVAVCRCRCVASRRSAAEDEAKEGYIENSVSLDASAQVCLTVACHWTFHPSPSLTSDLLHTWRTQLMLALDSGCAKTARVVEEEARQLLLERRRRHSVSLEVDAQKQLQMLSLKDARAVSHGSGVASSMAPNSLPVSAATSATTPRTSISDVKPKQINVAPKPEAKEQ